MILNTVKILTIASLLSLSSALLLAQERPKVMNEAKIGQLDRKLTTHKAKHRNFKTKSEYKRHKKHHHPKHQKQKYRKSYKYNDHMAEHYRYGYYEERFYGMPKEYPVVYGRTHRHPKRGWVLAYRYDRAVFYDRDGFYYGYFNRHGYYFEGVFYRYDRFYTYRDRVRGRGLFDRYFYHPAEYRYYGFCS